MTVRDEVELAMRSFGMATAQQACAFLMGPETFRRVKASVEPDILAELGIAPTRVCGLRVIVLQGTGGMMVVTRTVADMAMRHGFAVEIQ